MDVVLHGPGSTPWWQLKSFVLEYAEAKAANAAIPPGSVYGGESQQYCSRVTPSRPHRKHALVHSHTHAHPPTHTRARARAHTHTQPLLLLLRATARPRLIREHWRGIPRELFRAGRPPQLHGCLCVVQGRRW